MVIEQRIARAIERVPGWRVGDIEIVASLGGGPSSDSYLVERRQRQFVLRIDTDVARELGLDRESELAAQRAAVAAHLAPDVEYAAPERGVLLTHFVAGRAWQRQDLCDERNLTELAGHLRQLHELTPVVRDVDLAGALRHYAERVQTERAHTAARAGEGLLTQIGPRPRRLCHNDLNAQNLIRGERLWLIDWEYAALGDPYFDLAVVVAHHDLSDACRDVLLGAYCSAAESSIGEARDLLRLYCQLYKCLLALWSAVVEGTVTDSPRPSRQREP